MSASLPAFSLHNDAALVTGAGSGIGLGIARCLVAAGARVVLVGRRAEVLASAVGELGPRAAYVAADITRLDTADCIVTAAERAAGAPLSILVNNAGTHLKQPAVETTSADFDAVWRTHVLAAHALVRAAGPGMMSRRRGSILFTSSMAAFMGVPLVVAYAAAKSAYFGMVATLSAEFAPHRVRVNAIAPGWISSDMTRAALDRDPARKAKVMGRIQLGSMGMPEDIGWAAVYLSSPAAAYVTGVTLPVDGGAAIAF